MGRRLNNFVRDLLGLPDPCMIPKGYIGTGEHLAIRMKRHQPIYSDVIATGKTIPEVMKNAKEKGYSQDKFCIMMSPSENLVIYSLAAA